MVLLEKLWETVAAHAKLSLHVLVLLTAISLAVWDVTDIIREFVNDNRVTLIKIETANGTYPFLENSILRICIDYGEHTVFHETWDNETAKSMAADLIRNNRRSENVTYRWTDFDQMTLEDLLNAAFMFDDLGQMDASFIRRVAETIDSKSIEFKYIKKLWHMDDIIDHGYLEKLWSTLWQKIQADHLMFSNPFSLVYLKPKFICMEANASDLINFIRPIIYLVIGPIFNIPLGASPPNILEESITIAIDDFITTLPTPAENERLTNELKLILKNLAIHDRSRTTPTCSDRPLPIVYQTGHYRLLSPCSTRQALDRISEICQCIPFTYRSLITNRGQSPICSPTIYANCMNKIDSMKMHPVQCTPCKSVINDYSLETRTKPGSQYIIPTNDTGRHYRNELILECKNRVFTIYEEKPQLTTAQLWSQIGGDIGLYTGFSILSIWQLLVLTHTIYRSWKKSRSSQSDGMNQSFVQSLIGHYFSEERDHEIENIQKYVKQEVDRRIKEAMAEMQQGSTRM